MKRHAAFFIGLTVLIFVIGWLLKDNLYLLNETWWKTYYSSEDIRNGEIEVKSLTTFGDESFYITKYSKNTIQKLDLSGAFSNSASTVYLDMSNYYLMNVKGGEVTHKIFIDDTLGEVNNALSDGRGNVYIYYVKYGEYASWIEEEQIIKYNHKGQYTDSVLHIQYEEEERPYLTKSVNNLIHDDNGLHFFRNEQDALVHYTYTYNLVEDFRVDLSEANYQLQNITGHKLGELLFATNNSQIGIIKEDGTVEIRKSYLPRSLVVQSITPVENSSYEILLKGDGYNQIELAILDKGELKIERIPPKAFVEVDVKETVDPLSEGLRFSAELRTREWLYVLGVVLWITLLLYTIYFGQKYLMQGQTRIAIKQLVFLIPVVLVIMLVFVLQTVLSGFEEFGDEIKQGKYAQFNDIIDYQFSEVERHLGSSYLVDYLSSVEPYELMDEEKNNAFYDLMSLDNLQADMGDDTKKLREDIMAMYVVIDRVRDGKAYKILDTENNFKIFTQRSMTNKYFKKATTGEQVNAIGTGDAYIFSMRPIINEEHEVIGIYQIGMKYAGYRKQVDTKLVVSSVVRILLLTAALMLAITVTTVWSLRNIGKLTKGAREVSEGNLDVQIEIHSKDEVSELADAFNSMTENLSRHIADIKMLSESYYRFVPQEMFKLLGNENVRLVQKGDNGKFSAVLMAASIEGFYSRSKELTPEESFEWINEHLGYMGPIIRKFGGLIESYTDTGLVAIFTEDDARAIDAAIEINEVIQVLIDEGADLSPINMVLHRGDVLVGVIGEEKRLQSGIISDDVNFIQQMLTQNTLLSSHILMTEVVYPQILDERLYDTRYLGEIQIQGREDAHRIYDIYQGDATPTRLVKRQYLETFNNAITAFEQGDYYSARSGFVQILEMNLKDGASKVYFHISDQRLRADKKEFGPLRV